MTASTTRQHKVMGRGRSQAAIAGALMIGSAALQHLASLQRWALAPPVQGERSIEDHLFDYSWPADPWENVGVSAQLFGVAYLLLAPALLVAVGFRPAQGRATPVTAGVVASALGLVGVHALVSGVLGAPTVLQGALPAAVLGLAAPVGLVVLAIRLVRESPMQAASCVFLLGATVPGYLIAAFAIAPMLLGYSSFDTTPWTESVVAAAVAAAGLVLLLDAAVRPALWRTAKVG